MENIKRYEIAHKDYDLCLSLSTIYQFEEETGKEFHPIAYKAIGAWSKSANIDNMFERAAYMSEHVSRQDAAILFYHAARLAEKEKHFVTLDEMQDACMYEDAAPVEVDGKSTTSYPILFANLCMELLGSVRKKKVTE